MKGLFPDYADKTLDEFQVRDPSHELALQVVKDYIGNLIHMRETGHGLTFMGSPGVGKTMLSEMVLKYAQEEKYSVESIEMDSFIDLHREAMKWEHGEDNEGPNRASRHIRLIKEKIDFVLFDDISREHAGESGWSNHLLFNVLRYRANRRRPFIITSNLSPDEMATRYDEGFISLIIDKTTAIVIEGEDYRCKKDS